MGYGANIGAMLTPWNGSNLRLPGIFRTHGRNGLGGGGGAEACFICFALFSVEFWLGFGQLYPYPSGTLHSHCNFQTINQTPMQSHSVETPSMVDPQWNIWYWGSKWNLHTVCLDAVGCEWGTTSVYFRITYVCFIPSRLPVFAVEPQYRHQYFLFLSKVSFEEHIPNLPKNHVSVRFKWGL